MDRNDNENTTHAEENENIPYFGFLVEEQNLLAEWVEPMPFNMQI